MLGPITNTWCFQMLRLKEEYADTRPASISTRRQDEVPRLSRSRSTEVLGMLAAQIFSPEVPGRPVQDTTLGGPHTRVCRGAPLCAPSSALGDMCGEVSTLSRSCVLATSTVKTSGVTRRPTHWVMFSWFAWPEHCGLCLKVPLNIKCY